jgi:hypothetical protein
MTGTDASPKLLTPQLEELLGLVGDADSVELKLTVPDEDRQSAAAALGVDPLDARLRQVFFFDTPDLALDRAGVVVRARRTQGAPDDTVVNLRPVVPAELPSDLRARPDFVVEVDAMPGSFVWYRPRGWDGSSRSSCGSTPTARGSSSYPRSARRTNGSRP